MTAVLISVGYRVRNFRGRNGSWKLVHHHRVGRVNTVAAWVGLGDAFGNPYIEAILSCGFMRTLNKIWDTKSQLKTRQESTSKELSVKDGKRES